MLRKPLAKDITGFIEICAEKETMLYYGSAGVLIKTVADAQSQLNWCNALFNNNCGRWIITEIGIDEYIDDIGFHSIEKMHNRVEIGYRLKNAYWKKGIITEAIGVLLAYGFEKNNYNRVEALVDDIGSINQFCPF